MLLTSSVCVAQRYQRSFEVFGFPDGEQMGDSLKIAIPLLLIGLFFVFVIAKGNKGSKTKDTLGCIGWIILLIGVFFLFPLLIWVEGIVASIWNILLVIGIVIVIIGVIKGKQKHDI
ncbi:hypothetical protein DW778_12160 [Odoribacter splanchnicus]|nr:hypothetical protein DW778_12160 [Odoribacter splanchnicus]